MERKLREKAKQLGMGVRKKGEGYMLYDLLTNTVIAGAVPIEYCLSLDELAAELEERVRIE